MTPWLHMRTGCVRVPREHAVGPKGGACQGVRGAAGMTHDRDLPDAQGIHDHAHVGDRRSKIATWVTGRSAVPGPVIRHPADAALRTGREQRLRGRTDVRRAVVPDDGEVGIDALGQGVIDAEDAAVAEPQVSLPHQRSLTTVPHPPLAADMSLRSKREATSAHRLGLVGELLA